MSVEVVMPQMGESITEGTVSKWLKQVGERVEKDEAILEISTDKVDAEVPSPGAGILLEIRTPEGEYISWEEAYQRYGSEVDMISYDGTHTALGLSVVTRYVPGERYPAAVARLSALLGGGGLAALALTFLVVHRRRPY